MITGLVLAASAGGMSFIELMFAIAVPLATVVGAFLTWLTTRRKATTQELEDAEEKIDSIKERLDEALARQDIMLQYIYAMRRRDFEEGREPLPLPPELIMVRR